MGQRSRRENRVKFLTHNRDYKPPFEEELQKLRRKGEEEEAPKSHGPVSQVRAGVVKRVRSVEDQKEI